MALYFQPNVHLKRLTRRMCYTILQTDLVKLRAHDDFSLDRQHQLLHCYTNDLTGKSGRDSMHETDVVAPVTSEPYKPEGTVRDT